MAKKKLDLSSMSRMAWDRIKDVPKCGNRKKAGHRTIDKQGKMFTFTLHEKHQFYKTPEQRDKEKKNNEST